MNGVHLLERLLVLGAVVVLAAAATFSLFAFLRIRRARKAPKAVALPMLCPSCRRAFPAGTRFCPLDASRLISTSAAGSEGRGGRCPRCQRSFEAGMRFCPMDAEELVLHTHAIHTPSLGLAEPAQVAEHLVGGDGKICPLCASKYNLAAGYCGRDAAVLVTIN